MNQEKFISEAERLILLTWANENFDKLKQNGPDGCGRFFNKFSDLDANALLDQIREKIKTEFDVNNTDPVLTDYLSFNKKGAAINMHKDGIVEGKTQHQRFNVVIQAPESGGEHITEGDVEPPLVLKNGMIFSVNAGEVVHGSTPVKGKLDRIIISFGFQD